MRRATPFLLSAAIASIAIILYLPSVRGEFVYDGRAFVLLNDYVHHAGNLLDVATLRVMGMDEHKTAVELDDRYADADLLRRALIVDDEQADRLRAIAARNRPPG